MSTNTRALEMRPRRWEELVGQDLVRAVLTYNLEHGILHPGYMLAGTTGAGKTTVALLMARTLQCEVMEPSECSPCGLCRSCELLENGNHPDVMVVDGATDRSVEYVRSTIRPFLQSNPIRSRYRILVLDEVHQYQKDAISPFLTMLEDMPKQQSKSVIFFATTEPEKVVATIRNRCLNLVFAPIPDADLLRIAVEATGLPAASLETVVEQSGGSMRTLWSNLEVLNTALMTKSFDTPEAVYKALGWATKQDRLAIWATMAKGDIKALMTALDSLFSKHARGQSILGRQFMDDVMCALAITQNPDNFFTALRLIATADKKENPTLMKAALVSCVPLNVALQVVTGLRQVGQVAKLPQAVPAQAEQPEPVPAKVDPLPDVAVSPPPPPPPPAPKPVPQQPVQPPVPKPAAVVKPAPAPTAPAKAPDLSFLDGIL